MTVFSATLQADGSAELDWYEVWVFADGRRAGRLKFGAHAPAAEFLALLRSAKVNTWDVTDGQQDSAPAPIV